MMVVKNSSFNQKSFYSFKKTKIFFIVTRLGSAWHVASTTIMAPYKAFSREKLPARISANIGLMHVNVTLTGKCRNLNEKLIFFLYLITFATVIFLR